LNEYSAESITAFIEIVTAVASSWKETFEDDAEPWLPWFRGHANADWALVPAAYRYREINEEQLRSEFRRRGTPLITETPPKDDWDWYFLMQHFGIPTRLLDWTSGALLGLYFAVRERANVDAAVWMLDPFWLGERSIDRPYVLDTYDNDALKYLEPLGSRLQYPSMPVAIRPTHVSRRVAVQLSCFTVHGSNRDAFSALAEEPNNGLAKIRIPCGAVLTIAEQLSLSGIRETTVFPDLVGLSRELTSHYCTGLIC